MIDREKFIAEIKAKIQTARLAEQQKHATAAAHGIDYSETRRSENLRLLSLTVSIKSRHYADFLILWLRIDERRRPL